MPVPEKYTPTQIVEAKRYLQSHDLLDVWVIYAASATPDTWHGNTLTNLVNNLFRFKSLSEKQRKFAKSLANQIKDPEGSQPKKEAIDVSAIVGAFNNASAKLKRPKLHLANFVFSLAPKTGKNPGAIYVKQGEIYLGKIVNNEFTPTFTCDAPTVAKVIEVAASPKDAAEAFGHTTGSCAVCGKTLTNPESKRRGIGPICAAKFGW